MAGRNILIVVDTEDERITIFSSETQVLDIYDYDNYTEGDKTISAFKTIDKDGLYCRVRFVYNEFEDDRQLHVDYNNFIVAYTLKPLR